jgi:dipeptidyl aminopeptidase/acylaminoacyl peptidase
VTIPILLIHGDEDLTVPYEQSQVMEAALKRAGKTVTFVTLKHENHYLLTAATRTQMLTALIAFLEANNPPN